MIAQLLYGAFFLGLGAGILLALGAADARARTDRRRH